MKNRNKQKLTFDNPDEFYRTPRGEWKHNSEEPDLITDIFTPAQNFNQVRQIRQLEEAHQPILQTFESKKIIEKHKKNRRIGKKLFKATAKIATISALTVGAKNIGDSIIDPYTTVDNTRTEIKAKDFAIDHLDNSDLNINDYHKIQTEEDTSVSISVDKNGVIRSNNWTYEKMNERAKNEAVENGEPNHTAILQAKEKLTFNITQGEVLRGSNGRVGVRIENLEKTADGRATGIKVEADKDGWVFVDVTPDNLKEFPTELASDK